MNPRVVHLTFGDGEYPFAINIGEARELEALKGVGIGAVYKRILAGDWHHDDCYQIIRLGMIGGGMTPAEALQKCRTYVLDRPFAEAVPVALAVLLAAFHSAETGKAPASEPAMASPLAG